MRLGATQLLRRVYAAEDLTAAIVRLDEFLDWGDEVNIEEVSRLVAPFAAGAPDPRLPPSAALQRPHRGDDDLEPEHRCRRRCWRGGVSASATRYLERVRDVPHVAVLLV
ncbi:MAG: hypothetical protein M3N32_04200 [Actinomycetota bacterium]|nr:hypothetical protein [Actinomycetota bacterium]